MNGKTKIAIRFLLAPFVVLCLLTACGEQTALATIDPVAQTMIATASAETNKIRQANGLPPLTLDPGITLAAQGHANDMLARNYFEHQSLDGRSPFDRMRQSGTRFQAAAENIARGQRTAAQVFVSWMNSPGHRQNLLNARYRRHGLGWANGYWVHNFAD